MEQERVYAENDVTVENVENLANKESKDFDTQLKGLISQIKSIREIKTITDSEYDLFQQLNDRLTKKEREIAEINEMIKKLENDKRESNNHSSQADDLKNNNERCNKLLFLWITIWGILGVFSFCAIWLFMKTPWIENPLRLIPLLTVGLITLLIMAVLVITLGNQTKQVVTQKKDC